MAHERPATGYVRRRRRHWVREGRAHIEVRGVHRGEAAAAARDLEARLRRLRGVDWATVDHVLGRVVVAFDEGQTGPEELLDVVEAVEAAHDLAGEHFPSDRPDHPGDLEPLTHQRWAIAADVTGAAVGFVARSLRTNLLSAEGAALVGLVEATPALRAPLEERLGPVADLGLAAVHAMAQSFAGSNLPLLVDAVHRGLALREMTAGREAWERREGDLFGAEHSGAPAVKHLSRAVPPGPAERYAQRSSAAAFASAVLALAATRDPRLGVAATVAGNPKAARVGVEAFASVLGRQLAEQGVLPLDRSVLRRLDRVDTVVLDADALLTGGSGLGAVWVPPEAEADAEEAERRWLTGRLLFDPDHPSAKAQSDGWALAPVGRRQLAGDEPARAAWELLRRSGTGVLGLWTAEEDPVRALVAVEPRLDPLARVLAQAARSSGSLVVAGRRAGLADRLGAVSEVSGGTALAGEVQRLQGEGHVVAVVSARQHAALAAADVGIGVHRPGQRPPWGADLVTSRGLLDAWLVLHAVPAAREVARRSVGCSTYGAGAAGLAALAGPRAGATQRAGIAVNLAAAASMGLGAWAARRVATARAPSGEDRSEWHAMAAEDVLRQLGTRTTGLTREEAADRVLQRPAEVTEDAAVGVLRATMEELGNPLTPALATGAGLSAGLGSLTDAGLISGVMGLSAVVGGLQRVGADHAVQRLLDTGRPRVHVRRSGVDVLLEVDRLVVGDVVVLHAGDAVPADCRVLEAVGLELDESSLTGESQPVAKHVEPSAARTPADRRSMLYEGTAVAAGEAMAVVVALGADTEVGRSARTATGERRSGVEHRLRRLTSRTVPLALGAGAGLVGAGLVRGRRLTDTLGTGVGLAVAAVPEGLPFVATVAQLASARRLSGRDTLVRRPATIEALGRVDVLCADKTGTLTTGRISVRRVWDGSEAQDVARLDEHGRRVLAAALRATPRATATGQVAHPTDRAVLEVAHEHAVRRSTGAGTWRLETQLPFEPGRSYHAVLGRVRAGRRLSVKGSPEVVLPRCRFAVERDGSVTPLDPERMGQVHAEVEGLAREGYRVLAVAERAATDRADLDDRRIDRLELLGLLAMADPVRPAARESVAALREAGVAVVMMTGDHPSTAESIAAELGLLAAGGEVLTGAQLEQLSAEQLGERVEQVAVFARVSPSQKVRVVHALQERGRVVAMTGDGANDAAAIRVADVGVALGARATNAAKDAADVVVTDERLETLIDAILEGRAMWASVRDAVSVLVGGNLGEIAFTLGAELLARRGSPLNARQLLLVNLLTDLVPSMALAVRPPAGTDPARLAREGPEASLGAALTRDVVVRGAVTATAAGLGWQAGRLTGVTRRRSGTVALVSLVGSQFGQTLAAGWRDPLVVGSTLASGAALAAVVQTPGLSQFFGCRPLGPVGWAIGGAATAGSCVVAPLANRVVERTAPGV